MAGQISVSPEELRGTAQAVMSQANQARDNFQSLRGQVGALHGVFQGRAAEAFDQRYNEWDSSAQQLADALESLGEFLSRAADVLEEADTSLAGGLG